jgi:hypothetical protein
MSRNIIASLISMFICLNGWSQSNRIEVFSESEGHQLMIDGEAFFIKGMNWDYFPVGTNYEYQLWEQSDDYIKKALENEMSLLQGMGVNAIRQYTGVPSRWIQYIYETYGIYTMLNHSFGRYGLTVNEQWVSHTAYENTDARKVMIDELVELVNDTKDTPGLLMYLLGNENNYGLFWEGAETENIPQENQEAKVKARNLYEAMNQSTIAMKKAGANVPIAICNGDLLFLDIITEECKDIDIFGINIYRGSSFGDTYERVKSSLDLPVMFTEFGADAFDNRAGKEDESFQADLLQSNWMEIYDNAYGNGLAGNSIGGFTFQFSDGWWKNGQTKGLDIHDTHASWSNGGYDNDYVQGKNNMNEEWFGICAKSPSDEEGFYQLRPRRAYHVLKTIHGFSPYDENYKQQLVEKMSDVSNK